MPKPTTEYEKLARVSWDDPYVSAELITPADAALANGQTRAVHVTGAGNLAVIFVGDEAAVTIPVIANTIYRFAVKQINATNTTATGIIAYR